MKILLTGSEGMIGSELKKYWAGMYQLHFIDLKLGTDLNTCDLPKVDAVVHLAGKSGVRESFGNPMEYWKNNVMATKRLFDHYTDTPVYYASSSTAKEPYRNPYALTKYTLEQLAPEKSLGMRFTTVYGTQTRPQMFVPKLLRKEVTYINNHTRDFIHVSDVCRAITMFVQKNINGVIDVGTGKSYHLQQLLDAYGIDTIPMQEGGEHERKDNKADTNQLTAIGMVPRIDVIDYLCQEKELDKSEFSKYNVTIGD